MLGYVLINFITRFFSLLSAVFFVPFYIKFLGVESYSIITFGLIVFGVLNIFDAGLSASIIRELSKLNRNSQQKYCIFKTLERFYFFLSLIASLILFYVSDYLAFKWLKLSLDDAVEAASFLKILGFEIFFSMLLQFYFSAMMGIEKQIFANVSRCFWIICRNGMVIFVLLFYPSLYAFLIWQIFISFAFLCICRRFVLLCLESFAINKSVSMKDSLAILKEVMPFAFGMLSISLVGCLSSQLDKLLISKYLQIDVLGYYTIAVSLSMGLVSISTAISSAFQPKLIGLYSLSREIEARDLACDFNLLCAILLSSSSAILFFFSHEILWIVYGDIVMVNSISPYIPLLSITFSMLAIAMMPFNVAIAHGYLVLNNFLGVLSLFFIVPAYYFLIHLYGAFGAALTGCINQVLITFVYYYVVSKRYGFDFYELFLKRTIYPFFIAFLFVYIVKSTMNGYINCPGDRLYTLCEMIILGLLSIGVNLFVFYKKCINFAVTFRAKAEFHS